MKAPHWTPYEDAVLRQFAANKATVAEATDHLGRPYEGAMTRARKLKVRFRRAAKPQPRKPMAPGFALLHAQLCWHYGPERTDAIFAGADGETNADLAAWRKLGR